MDTETSRIHALTSLNHPAQLWVGATTHLITCVEQYLQSKWCSSGGCTTCATCTAIAHRQYHQLLWLEPEKQYTLDLIDQIADTMCYTLDPGASFYIILVHADTLTTASSNRLLKAIEEPPPGYHFIFLAQRLDAIIPTIRSRCIIETWAGTPDHTQHQKIIDYLTGPKAPAAIDFLVYIDTLTITEYQSLEILDHLLTHWLSIYKKARLKNDLVTLRHTQPIIMHLKKSMLRPPMPGSTKLFWKNLFLQMYG